MPTYIEQDLLTALNDVKNGKSVKCAYKDWGVPCSILHDCNQGRESHIIAAKSQ
jgi:hypothetical protein